MKLSVGAAMAVVGALSLAAALAYDPAPRVHARAVTDAIGAPAPSAAAAIDAPPDAAIDASLDAAIDAPPDAAIDAPPDAAIDAGPRPRRDGRRRTPPTTIHDIALPR